MWVIRGQAPKPVAETLKPWESMIQKNPLLPFIIFVPNIIFWTPNIYIKIKKSQWTLAFTTGDTLNGKTISDDN